VKTYLEITPEIETTYTMPDALFDWIEGWLIIYGVILGTRSSVRRLYDILPPEMREMISVTTEHNPGEFNGHTITVCNMDEYKAIT